MRTIRLFITQSINGFSVPYERQLVFDPKLAEYKKYYQESIAVLASRTTCSLLTDVFGVTADKIIYTDEYVTSSGNIDMTNIEHAIRLFIKNKRGYIAVLAEDKALVAHLLNAKLVYSLSVCVLPLLIGKGEQIFPNLSNESEWHIRSREIFDSGMTITHYLEQYK